MHQYERVTLPANLFKTALPFLAKQLPKLWPLLLETKNRDKLMELARSASSASPSRRLAGKLELTEELAKSLAERGDSQDEAQRARSWQRRAHNMRVRLDMPISGRQQKRAHRRALEEDLNTLHQEISEALSQDAPQRGELPAGQ